MSRWTHCSRQFDTDVWEKPFLMKFSIFIQQKRVEYLPNGFFWVIPLFWDTLFFNQYVFLGGFGKRWGGIQRGWESLIFPTWMFSLEVRINGLIQPTYKYGIHWGYNPLNSEPFDPNFQPGHPSVWFSMIPWGSFKFPKQTQPGSQLHPRQITWSSFWRMLCRAWGYGRYPKEPPGMYKKPCNL